MALEDIYQIRIRVIAGVQEAVNVLHMRTTLEAGNGATPIEIASVLSAEYAPLYKAVLSDSAIYQGVGVQRIRPLPVGVEAFSPIGAGAGVVPDDPLPQQVSGLITLRTSLSGRRQRGRKYIPFPAEFHNDDDVMPSNAYLNGLISLAQEFVSADTIVGALGTTGLNPVIFHRDLGTSDLVTSAVARATWATQRRRGGFGRPNTPSNPDDTVVLPP